MSASIETQVRLRRRPQKGVPLQVRTNYTSGALKSPSETRPIYILEIKKETQ